MLVIGLLLLGPRLGLAQTLNIDAAKGHFAAGKAYYEESRWDEALREFREAYRLSRRPALLFNIGICHEKLLRYQEAIDALKQYLADEPRAQDRPSVEEKIASLDALLHAPAPPAAVVAQPPQPPAVASPTPAGPGAPPRRRLATWMVGGAGVALLLSAIGTGVAAHSNYNTLAGQCGASGDLCPPGFQATRDQGQALQGATIGLVTVGAVALATSVALFFVEGRPRRVQPAGASLSPALWPGGAGLAGALRF